MGKGVTLSEDEFKALKGLIKSNITIRESISSFDTGMLSFLFNQLKGKGKGMELKVEI